MLTVSQKENVAATAMPDFPQDDRELVAAHAICGDVRLALKDMLAHVAKGARDLRAGQSWSADLDRFEQVSMEQARILARFPIRTTDQRFGALVHRARASFVAFRETVRREIIGCIDRETDDAACGAAMEKVTGRSVLADNSLKSIERAITQYWAPFSAALQQDDSSARRCADTGG